MPSASARHADLEGRAARSSVGFAPGRSSAHRPARLATLGGAARASVLAWSSCPVQTDEASALATIRSGTGSPRLVAADVELRSPSMLCPTFCSHRVMIPRCPGDDPSLVGVRSGERDYAEFQCGEEGIPGIDASVVDIARIERSCDEETCCRVVLVVSLGICSLGICSMGPGMLSGLGL